MSKRRAGSEQVEEALVSELERLERRVQRLKQQQDVIKNALAEHRIKNLSYKGALRKTSFSRLLVERKILKLLKDGIANTDKIYEAVSPSSEKPRMNPATFRSHLHKLKEEGLIISGPSRGTYRLPIGK